MRSDQTHRQLRPRHIQLIGIGGTIGTALYVQIGKGLLNGGPGSLFLAFTIWYAESSPFSQNLDLLSIQPFSIPNSLFKRQNTDVIDRCTFILAVTNVSDKPQAPRPDPSPKLSSPKQLTLPQVHERNGHVLANFFAIHSICRPLC